MDDHGKRLDAVAQGNSDGVAGYESEFHGVVGDVWVDFHSAPPPLVIDNQTLNLGLGQDLNSSIYGIVNNIRNDFHGATPPLVNDNQTSNLGLGQDLYRSVHGVEISYVCFGDTSFHVGHALGGVDSRLPSVSSGTHGLVDSGAHGLVLGATCVSCAN
ncbi:hypothetical protein PanWU01x14_362010, partial [Parasponia andersonii]